MRVHLWLSTCPDTCWQSRLGEFSDLFCPVSSARPQWAVIALTSIGACQKDPHFISALSNISPKLNINLQRRLWRVKLVPPSSADSAPWVFHLWLPGQLEQCSDCGLSGKLLWEQAGTPFCALPALASILWKMGGTYGWMDWWKALSLKSRRNIIILKLHFLKKYYLRKIPLNRLIFFYNFFFIMTMNHIYNQPNFFWKLTLGIKTNLKKKRKISVF